MDAACRLQAVMALVAQHQQHQRQLLAAYSSSSSSPAPEHRGRIGLALDGGPLLLAELAARTVLPMAMMAGRHTRALATTASGVLASTSSAAGGRRAAAGAGVLARGPSRNTSAQSSAQISGPLHQPLAGGTAAAAAASAGHTHVSCTPCSISLTSAFPSPLQHCYGAPGWPRSSPRAALTPGRPASEAHSPTPARAYHTSSPSTAAACSSAGAPASWSEQRLSHHPAHAWRAALERCVGRYPALAAASAASTGTRQLHSSSSSSSSSSFIVNLWARRVRRPAAAAAAPGGARPYLHAAPPHAQRQQLPPSSLHLLPRRHGASWAAAAAGGGGAAVPVAAEGWRAWAAALRRAWRMRGSEPWAGVHLPSWWPAWEALYRSSVSWLPTMPGAHTCLLGRDFLLGPLKAQTDSKVRRTAGGSGGTGRGAGRAVGGGGGP